MGTTYTQGEGDVVDRCKRVLKDHHPELYKAKVTVDLLLASNEDNDAVTLHGYKCAAIVRTVSYKQRVYGRSDAEIVIDALWWNDATDRQKDALLDHELTHLEVRYDARTGAVKRDRMNRPKLATRTHDWQMGGFEDVARRYGKDAPEVIVAKEFKEKFGQLCFEFSRGAA